MSPTLPPWRWLHQDGLLVLSLLLFLPFLALVAHRRSRGSSTRAPRFPPSPPKLPFIGNLHQVGSCPHRSLAALAQAHGPLMLLQLGQVPTLVVSSAGMAEQIMKTHDVVFANRPQLEVPKHLFYGCTDVAFSTYGEYWRNLRRVCSLHLFSARRVQSYQPAREEEVALMVEKIEQLSSGGVVDLTEILHEFVIDLMSRAIHGRCFREEGLNRVFRDLMEEHVPLLTRFHVGDYFRSLRWLSVFSGLDSMARRTAQKWDCVLGGLIQSHLNRSGDDEEPHQQGFVDVLLALQKDPSAEFYLTEENIKAVLLDMLAAGTDTSLITLDWAMAELIRNPEAMKRAQAEVRGIAGAKPSVEEADAAQMEYLRAVIKETLRLHPPGTLLVPHQSSEDTHIDGFQIPKQTTVHINAWAIMRDPHFWEAPEEFRPERFLDAYVDFRGKDFQFIPFGAGRRICPGMQFAVAAMQPALANLLHRFDWVMPDGKRGEDLDMAETFGITTHRKHNLRLVPIPRSC